MAAVDPSVSLLGTLAPGRIIVSVIYIVTEAPQPGFIHSAAPHRILLDGFDGTPSGRLLLPAAWIQRA
jgi:hypothetical protein